jgi:hypothetical protein
MKSFLKNTGVNKLTTAQMGGLECGKCHYQIIKILIFIYVIKQKYWKSVEEPK